MILLEIVPTGPEAEHSAVRERPGEPFGERR
jgi:hypothetical protein